ncbi:MAG: butyrate kinase [Candidatus Aerophobetes bacterium]|nr:butyrate kinase [Candidatus Aerophobetes bacterium]
MIYRILVINPGSTSTRISFFEDKKQIVKRKISHNRKELSRFPSLLDQQEFREKVILKLIKDEGYTVDKFDALAARGGILKPLSSGTYTVNEEMVNYLKYETPVEHPSNLAAIIAYDLSKQYHTPAYIVDPVSVDEFDDVARVCGIPEIQRRSLDHPLNLKAAARRCAKKLGKPYEELNLITVHLGGGISVIAHRKGKMVDGNNTNDEGPFTPGRAGEVPVGALVEAAYSGKYTYKELYSHLVENGGIVAYLGTDNLKEAMRSFEKGEEKARLVLKAMVYQISKEIYAISAVLKGKIDAIAIAGGMAYEAYIVNSIREYISNLALVLIFPGEMEMEALASGALRVLKGEERAKIYK